MCYAQSFPGQDISAQGARLLHRSAGVLLCAELRSTGLAQLPRSIRQGTACSGALQAFQRSRRRCGSERARLRRSRPRSIAGGPEAPQLPRERSESDRERLAIATERAASQLHRHSRVRLLRTQGSAHNSTPHQRWGLVARYAQVGPGSNSITASSGRLNESFAISPRIV